MSKRPLYVILEGNDGAGKSVLKLAIKAFLEENNIPATFVREPGGTPMAEAIRDIFKDTTGQFNESVDVMTELYLLYAARNQLLTNVVSPALSAGNTVVSDRSWLSTFAYQQMEFEELLNVHNPIMLNAPPITHVLYLDVEPTVGLARAKGRAALDRIEQRDIRFFNNVRQRYAKVLKQFFPDNHLTIDTTNMSVDEVKTHAINYLKNII